MSPRTGGDLRGIAAGNSVRRIAARLGRAASTISREITKNTGASNYRAVEAHDRASRRARRPQRLKLQKNPVVRNYVAARLKEDWSPEQIAGRLLLDYPHHSRMHISHEAIYRAVYLNSGHQTLPHNIHHLRFTADIVNDPNAWAKEQEDPRNILDRIKKITTVSVETVRLVSGLRTLRLDETF